MRRLLENRKVCEPELAQAMGGPQPRRAGPHNRNACTIKCREVHAWCSRTSAAHLGVVAGKSTALTNSQVRQRWEIPKRFLPPVEDFGFCAKIRRPRSLERP